MTSSRPIRVLHLRDSPWVDGPGRTILETATRIDPERIDYHVGAFVSGGQHPLVEAMTERGLNVHAIRDRPGVAKELVDEVTALLERLQIDVLHTSEFRSNVLALRCRGRRPLRLVSTAHGWVGNTFKGKIYTILDRVILRGFDRVVLVSHAMRRRLPSWWLPDRQVRVLHNALMTESYGHAVLGAERRAPERSGPITLLNVGRLSPEKGQLLLLEAVAQLSTEYPGLRLAFAGVGPLEAALRAKAAELGITERVDFLGYISDMPSLYAKTDLVVQSSFTEGLPNVMLEVAYLGVPVLATDVGGTREVIEHNVSGYLIPPKSVAALVQGLRSYLEDPARFIEMARAGRQRIESHFTFPARTEAQMRLYEEVVASRA